MVPIDPRRLAVQKVIAGAKFQQNSKQAEDILVRAIENARDYRANPHASYKGKKVTRDSFGTDRPKGRKDETLIRAVVMSALFRSWLLGFGASPRINNKGYPASPFVIFAEPILRMAGIGKIEDHLEQYRSYRKKALENFHVK
jgi:hypothetical protein